MRLPKWDELASVQEQLDVLEHPLDQSLFVAGPPGSGKTVLAVQRAQMLAEAPGSPTVVLLTYNRMLRRLMFLLADATIDISTMQSFIWRDYSDRTGARPPCSQHDPYAYDWPVILAILRGHAQTRPTRSHLIVDEGQDLPKGFFHYASRHIAPTLTVFADENQALTEECTTLEQIAEAADLSNPYILTQNHRNTPEVARLAEHFHAGRIPVASVVRPPSGDLPRLVRSESLGFTARRVANSFTTVGESIGVIVSRNQYGGDIRRELQSMLPGVRVKRYESTLQNDDAIDVLQSGITILNKESVKGQEFDTVFILELEDSIPCTNDVQRRAMYMMCTRARDSLFLVHGPQLLSPVATAALPGPQILERA